MALYRFQTVLNAASGVPADGVTGTLYYDCDDDGAATTAADDIADFYVTISPRLSNLLSTTSNFIKIYRMLDPEPRAPVAQVGLGGALTLGSNSLPPEVALCLSFQGAKVSGLKQASRRGRLYLGPMPSSVSGTDGRPLVAALNDISTAAAALLSASDAAATYTWVVYSPTLGTFTPVTDGWVDNEYDTQRSRGRIATNRVTFT